MTETVSVVVPVKDGGAALPRLRDALAALDWPADRLERIVVDNGSTDGSRERAEAAGVRVVVEVKPGSYAARNRGIWRSSTASHRSARITCWQSVLVCRSAACLT